jgi:hypothetical protein
MEVNVPYKTAVRFITGIEDQKKAEKEFKRFFMWLCTSNSKEAKAARSKARKNGLTIP